jgi:predicted ArsR family transcriptional regulator
VTVAIETIGNDARTEVLKVLWATDGPLGAPELAKAVGTNYMTTYRHLRALEDAGIVRADLAIDERAGRPVTWTVDRDAVRAAAATWLGYVSGGEVSNQ